MTDTAAERPTILIVDDEDVIRDLIADVVAERGYRVLTAATGTDAIKIVRTEMGAISLVVLDMLMPDMDGRRTFELMKEIVPGIRVLVATGFGREDIAESLFQLGVRGVVSKPFHVDELLKLIESNIGS